MTSTLIVVAAFLVGVVAGVILYAIAVRTVAREVNRNFAVSNSMFRTASRVLDDIMEVGRRVN